MPWLPTACVIDEERLAIGIATEGYRRALKGATSETVPIELAATTRTWYAPEKASAPVQSRPFQSTFCGPGWSFLLSSVARTTPLRVSTVAVTFAGWASWNVAASTPRAFGRICAT